ncbi:DUF4133 domain-containing protein [Pinibacter aurantiacus]|uniref:DUF4133 domain-containing protein n=1 Tax=Pinibacter aurantiacus TaxID=2851599 RepID=A0A9E2SCM8_9BACT|nr:DUF4133 domain-containing protein [Pinibacter aurantiacus]MBV4359079.1 DUF4133 domain-containing protein [Pinibacter aurantiacus]
MAASIYTINKGVNKSIEFKGLKAQYIWYLAGGLLVLLILFAILYVVGVNTYICLIIILGCGTVLFTQVYRMSKTYGAYGLMKKAAKRKVPQVIKCHSRKMFIKN